MPYIMVSDDDKHDKSNICIVKFEIGKPEVDRIQFILERRSNGDIFECEINNTLNPDIDIMTVEKELKEARSRLFLGKSLMKIDSENNSKLYYLYIKDINKRYSILMIGFNCEMFPKEMKKACEDIKNIGYYIINIDDKKEIDSYKIRIYKLKESIKDAYKEKYGIKLTELEEFYSKTTYDICFAISKEKIPKEFNVISNLS